jgi:hypothetical protein
MKILRYNTHQRYVPWRRLVASSPTSRQFSGLAICKSGVCAVATHMQALWRMNTDDVLPRFQDLKFPLELEFGSLEVSIREMLELNVGSVLRTSHPARAPLTLRAGDAPIAAVETLVNGGALSVRVQNILDSVAKPDDGN